MRILGIRKPFLYQLSIMRPLTGVILALLLICGCVFGVRTHRDLHRLGQASRLSRILLSTRARIFESYQAPGPTGSGRVPAGFLSRLQNRDDMNLLAMEGHELLDGDTLSLRLFDSALRESDQVLDASVEAFLFLVEAGLARDRGAGERALDLESRARAAEVKAGAHRLEACASMNQLGAGPQLEIEKVASGSGRIYLLLASALFLVLLLGSGWYSQRHQIRYFKGARLVEEMLEAYSRRLEEMNAELEQVSLLKTQFLANTSHELLTPLNGIMGSLELLRDGNCAGPGEERECLNQAYHSAERLLALIHDLLDLCRLEEGNLSLRSRGIESGNLVDRALATHRASIEERGLALLVVPPAEGWPRVQADPERLGRVLQHLLSNAVKFTERGSIRINGRLERDGTTQLRLEVADTGVGIEPAKLPHVFELFQQGDGSDTRRYGGTGLGLTLCRHLIQGMGGKIGMESDGLGRGARAWFTVPVAQVKSQGMAGPPACGPNSPDRLKAA